MSTFRAVTTGSRRRLRLLATLVLLFAGVLAGTASAAAQSDEPSDPSPAGTASSSADAGFVDVVEVSGLLDPVLANFIERAVADGADSGARWVVLQVNSPGSVISDERLEELARTIAAAPVRVAAWVGPSGSKAKGELAQLLATVDEIGVSAGSRFGDTGELVLPVDFVDPDLASVLADVESATVGAEQAAGLGLARSAPTIGDFLIGLEDFEVEIDDSGDEPRSLPLTRVRFGQLPLIDQGFHTIASPAVAYLLFLIGMGLLVFELFTAGVGIAGVIGAFALIGGCYGLDVLPARWWAVGLLVFAMFGFAVDVQVGVPRAWTAIGTVSLVVGSLALYDGVSMSWITLLTGLVGMFLAMVSGMPAMVRTRFSTPTIGREWLIGEEGAAVDPVDPEGVVLVRDSRWKARTNRATPIAVGAGVRVIAIEGLILQVEPLEGAARDYRERR